MVIQWEQIWQRATREFKCDGDSVHGPAHWRRVERNGLLLAARSGAIENVVKLFAVFHDSKRVNDDWDAEHGARAAAYAKSLRGVLFEITDEQFQLLDYACTWHAHGKLSNDPTIGTCWDADRLDLARVHIRPEPDYMSTQFGKEIAMAGSIQKFL